MSDQVENQNIEEEELEIKKPSGNKAIIILAAVNVLALAGAGVAISIALNAKSTAAVSDDGEAEETEKKDEKKEEKKSELVVPPGQPGPVMDLETFVVNLDEPQGNRYLKLKISLELAGEPARAYIEARVPRIRDALIAFLSSLQYQAVRGAQGKTLVKDGVHERIAEIAPAMVTQVFITDFVVQ